MPPYYAPCLPATHPAIEYGEELLYPDFEVRQQSTRPTADMQCQLYTRPGQMSSPRSASAFARKLTWWGGSHDLPGKGATLLPATLLP